MTWVLYGFLGFLLLLMVAHLGRNRILDLIPHVQTALAVQDGCSLVLERAHLDHHYRLHLSGGKMELPDELHLAFDHAVLGGLPGALFSFLGGSPFLESLEGVLRAPGPGVLGGEWVLSVGYRAAGPSTSAGAVTGDLRLIDGFLQAPDGRLPYLSSISGAGKLKLHAGAFRLDGSLELAHSRLALELRQDAETRIDGSRIHGTIHLGDLDALFPPEISITTPNGEPAQLDLSLRGTRADPTVTGEGFVRSVRLVSPAPTSPLTCENFTARIRADGDVLRIESLSGALLEGHLEMEGVYRRGVDEPGFELEVRTRGLRIETVPTDGEGGPGLAPYLRGALTGEISLRGKGSHASEMLDLIDLAARGELRLDDPSHLWLRAGDETLGGYQLPPLSPRGKGPTRVRFELRRGKLTASLVEATTRDLRATGEVEISPEGKLSGEIEAWIHRDYLAKSPLLAFPAAMIDEVQAPVTLAGTLTAPDASVDLAGIIEQFLARTRVGTILRGTMDTLWATFESEGIQPGPELDHIIETILGGGDESEEYLDRLIATGISAEDVQALVDDYRERQG